MVCDGFKKPNDDTALRIWLMKWNINLCKSFYNKHRGLGRKQDNNFQINK